MTATPPELWLLVGGNGAGKTTFHQQFLAPRGIPLVNADNVARLLWPDSPEKHSYEASLLAGKERSRLLDERRSFCFETVYSHPSKVFRGTGEGPWLHHPHLLLPSGGSGAQCCPRCKPSHCRRP